MKCENCTKKECSKKQKNDDPQNTPVDVLSSNDENKEKSEFHKLANAKVFLSDCLACDSCITAEEAVRVFQQNQNELFRVLNLNKKCDTSKHKILAVSICPQSLPYFAAKFNLSVTEAARRLCGFLKSLGVHYVFDTTIAADFSLLESQKEFVRRYRQQNQEEHALPMFSSACPGWIQYAERVLPSMVIPHICTAKSPQQIMGSLVKGYFARQQNLSPDKIFHIIVAPCYDKKLEALREDFYTHLYNSQDVDCVLTSGEVFQMMEQRKISLNEISEVSFDTLFGGIKEDELNRHDGRRSDGYLEHVFKHAAKELFDTEVKEITYKVLKSYEPWKAVTLELWRLSRIGFPNRKPAQKATFCAFGAWPLCLDGKTTELERQRLFLAIKDQDCKRFLRNKDFQEVTLEKDGETVLRFAAAYGFRNIQNMILKLKKGKCSYHFVEVLACPGGCLNGNGQAQTEDGKPDKALLKQMEDVYATVPVQVPETNGHVQKLYQEWLEGMDSIKAQESLHTKYSMEKPAANNYDIKW